MSSNRKNITTVDSDTQSSYSWVVLSTFTLSFSMVLISIITIGLLLPDISEELNLSPSQQGFLASSVPIANLFLLVPVNWWISRFKPWRVASISFGASAIFLLFGGWAPTFALLVIARVGLGIAFLISEAPRTIVVIQWIPLSRIPRANGILFSVIELFVGVGYMGVPLVLLWLDDWRTTLQVWSIFCFASWVLWLVLGRDRITPEYQERMKSQVGTPLKSLLKYKEMWILGMGMLGVAAGRTSINAFWPTLTLEEYGTSITWTGLVIGTMAVASAPFMLVVSFSPFIKRRTPQALIVGGVGLSLSYFGMLFTGSLPLLFLFAVILGISFSFFPLMFTMLYELPGIRPREVAIGTGLIFSMLWVGAATGPLIVGFIEEATENLRLGLLVTSVGPITMIAAGFMLLARKKQIAKAPALANTG